MSDAIPYPSGRCPIDRGYGLAAESDRVVGIVDVHPPVSQFAVVSS